MKEYVSVEELNAATILLTGISVNQLAELHIAGSAVSAISADGEGNLKAHRIMIGKPAPPTEEPGDTEDEETPEDSPGETDEDDGTQEE